jgi:integration host factor subunit alpha
MTIPKDSLIQSLCDQWGFSKQKSKALESGDDVLISGFGKFSVKKKAARRGRNPATGEDLILDARTVVNFRCSPVLREKVNAGHWVAARCQFLAKVDPLTPLLFYRFLAIGE